MRNLEINNRPSHTAKEFHKKTIVELLVILVFSLIFGISSGIFTNDSALHNEEKCIKLLSWSQWFFYLMCMMFGFSAIMLIVFKYDNSSPQSEQGMCLKSCYSVFQGFVTITFFSIFIGFCYTYDLGENCGGLRTFVLVVMILTIIVLSLSCLMLSCWCAMSIWTVIKIKREIRNSVRDSEMA